MIQFTCPCGKALHAKDEYAGQTTRCPDCGRDLDIPGETGVKAAGPRVGRPSDEAVRRSRPDRPDDADFEERPRPTTTSGKAVASLILGVLSLFLCSVFTGLPAILFGALGLRDVSLGRGRVHGKGLAIAGLVTGGLSFLLLPVLLIGLLIPSVQKVREAAGRIESANNLKQISLAMQSYQDANGALPAAAICDPAGKPLLSWRVAILPYIEQENLYQQFKLDEPWDGPNNSKLIPLMPKTYAMTGDTTAQPGSTHYLVFVGNGAAFDEPRPGQGFGVTQGVHLTDFTDGTANTILVAEATKAAPWTKPEDLTYDPNGPLPPLGGRFSGGFNAVMANGSIHFISTGVSQQTLRAAITRGAGDVVGPDW